jgi:hypothetical protein
MAAIKNGHALIATATGPYKKVTPDVDRQPSGADMLVAFDLSNFVNRFMRRGDPPR